MMPNKQYTHEEFFSMKAEAFERARLSLYKSACNMTNRDDQLRTLDAMRALREAEKHFNIILDGDSEND